MDHTPPARLSWMDTAKVLLTVGVIAAHALITYGPEGSWFYREGGLPDGVWLPLGLPLAIGSLFAMGVFFFLAGLLVPASLRRKGQRGFLAGRWARLGWPVALFVVVLVPLIEWLVRRVVTGQAAWGEVFRRQLVELDAGPVWFLWVLLLFSTCAAFVPGLGRVPGRAEPGAWPFVLAAVGIAGVSFLTRVWLPVDSYQVGAAHLWQWGQCLGAFALGVLVGRNGWLGRVPARFAWVAGVGAGISVLALVGAIASADGDLDPFGGGWSWQSAVVSAAEGVVCVSACVLLTRLPARQPGSLAALGPASYGAYLLQTPVLVGLALLLSSSPLPAAGRLAVLLPVSFSVCFAGSALLRKAFASRPSTWDG